MNLQTMTAPNSWVEQPARWVMGSILSGIRADQGIGTLGRVTRHPHCMTPSVVGKLAGGPNVGNN